MFNVYTIKKGETLESIANSLNVNPDFLRAINGLNKNYVLKENDQIIIPIREESKFDTYIVVSGDTLYNIAQRFGIALDDLLLINGLNKSDYIYPGQQILVPNKNMGVYVSKEGDTIGLLTQKLNKSVQEILSRNPNLYLLPDQLIIYNQI